MSKNVMHVALALMVIAVVIACGYGVRRVLRVNTASNEIPVYSEAREGPSYRRFWPRLLSWDDRSSARVDRIFALPKGTTLLAVARAAAAGLASRDWYLVSPSDLRGTHDPQVIVWQRDPDERLDLIQLWPDPYITREQRLYGGRFPRTFLDEPMVIGWTWYLGGPRSPRPLAAPTQPVVRHP
ncbi:MAG TPA: hypothetical protein VE131_07670 [Terriglobales bacterium]|nr:hypothetical protein [Terriglobales bacterium]